MKVLNVAGFNLKFERNERVLNVPNDGQLHFVPDDYFFAGESFDGMLRVVVPPDPVKTIIKKMEKENKIVDINDPTIKEIVIEKIKEKESKPLKGKKLKSSVRTKLRKTRPTGRKKEVTKKD